MFGYKFVYSSALRHRNLTCNVPSFLGMFPCNQHYVSKSAKALYTPRSVGFITFNFKINSFCEGPEWTPNSSACICSDWDIAELGFLMKLFAIFNLDLILVAAFAIGSPFDAIELEMQ